MAISYHWLLGDPIETARSRCAAILAANGFATLPSPTGGLIASRGSALRTLILGGLAGSGLRLNFDVEFESESDRTTVRLARRRSAGALTGGVIGATRTASVFDELGRRVEAALADAGVLLESRSE